MYITVADLISELKHFQSNLIVDIDEDDPEDEDDEEDECDNLDLWLGEEGCF